MVFTVVYFSYFLSSSSSSFYSNDKIFLDSFLISVPQPSTFKIAEIEKKKGKSMAFSKESFNISQYNRVLIQIETYFEKAFFQEMQIKDSFGQPSKT